MKTVPASVGARCVDSLPFSQAGTAQQAAALAASGVDGFIGYLGCMTAARLQSVLNAGMAFMPVTIAGEYNDGPQDEVGQLRALGLPYGCTVWLDLEGMTAWSTDPKVLIGKIDAWADGIAAAGYMPGLYVGAPQPLTGDELYALRVKRYWLGQGRCVDRYGKDAYPKCGWCLRQDWHGQTNGLVWRDTGILVDTNAVQCDHMGRLPAWVVGD